MSLASRPASRWAVSTRSGGEVLTASIRRSELELCVLGVPAGFGAVEVEGWLHDLAGVAVETSRADSRARAIPSLMHHALTGLLFSHAELWDRLEGSRPCSSAFVDLPDGAAFGWVGDARVHVMVDGDPVEPQWVRVRDDAGREARAAVFAPGSDVVVTLDYWPKGEGEGPSSASLEAEWNGEADAELPTRRASPAHAGAGASPAWPAPETPRAEAPAPGDRADEPARALPESLPQQQPGLAPAATTLPHTPSTPPQIVVPAAGRASAGPSRPSDIEPVSPLDILLGDTDPQDEEPAPRVREPEAPVAEAVAPAGGGAEMPALPASAEESVAPEASASSTAPAAQPESSAPRAPHPVARWLSRVMNWGRPAASEPEPMPGRGAAVSAAPEEGAPVSMYDSLLSESVTGAPPEQVALELPSTAEGGEAPGTEPAVPETVAAPAAPDGAPEPLVLDSPAPVSPGAREPEPADAADAGAAAAASAPSTAPAASDTPALATAAVVPPVPAAEPGAPIVVPDAPRPAQGTLRPAGLADILGGGAPAPAPAPPEARPTRGRGGRRKAKASTPAPEPVAPESVAPEAVVPEPVAPEPVAPPRAETVSAPVEVPVDAPADSEAANVKLASLLREIESADPARLPVISPEIPAGAARRPLHVDHEPVGADESFGIPPLPDELRVGMPAEDRFTDIAPLPAEQGEGPEAAIDPAFDDVITAGVPLPLDAPANVPAGPAERETPVSPRVLRVAVPERTAGADDGSADDPLFPVSTRRVRSLETPEPPARPKFRMPRRAGVWAAGVVIVFVLGWLVGGVSNPGADRGGPLMAALRAVGLGGARFTLEVNSSPGGATIEVDGRMHPARTPATIELPPGEHVVRLGMPGLGSVEVPVKGRRGEKRAIDESLEGSLEILDPDANVPLRVSVDGRAAGYAPVKIESIAPGLHEIGFSGPGMAAWAQTVQVEVRGATQLVARPMAAPASGVLQVQATINDERGASPLSGAQVHVDGEPRGATPLTIELPRGPHSLRVTWRGETAPIQVIDLPGGNQRYATFQFGLDLDAPRLAPIGSTKTFAAGQPKVVSASLTGLSVDDVQEAWLHVRTPEGIWRRYEMTVMRGAGGLVISSVFPDNVFDRTGSTRWYLRVVTRQGDETFSEVQRSSLAGSGGGERSPQ